MSVQGDVFQELIQRVTALEGQLARLRDCLKRDEGRDTGEDIERITPVQPADFAPFAYCGEPRVFARDLQRFLRRAFREGVNARE